MKIHGNANLSFDFVGYTGPQVRIAEVEFFLVEQRDIDLLAIQLPGGEQQAWGEDAGKVETVAAQPMATKNLPPGFIQVKEPEL